MAEGIGQSGTGGGRLLDTLQLFIQDAQQRLRASGGQPGEYDEATLARLAASLGITPDELLALEQKLNAAARDAVQTTGEYVRRHPWQSVGIGAVAGVLLGMWIGRR